MTLPTIDPPPLRDHRAIPLALVTGFLGCGKTTFLLDQARRLAHRKPVFLVNEFSSFDVDGARLEGCGPDTVSIAGGSIFCKCMVSEFILQLSELPVRFPAAGAVVVEASGMANPLVVGDLLRDTGLDGTFELTSVICLADPGSLPKLIGTLTAMEAQLAASDAVLLNKCDLFAEPRIRQAEELIRIANPQARILRTERAQADLELFGPRPQRDRQGQLAECRDSRFVGLSAAVPGPVDLDRLRAALLACQPGLFRAKGVLDTATGAVELDLSDAGIDLRPAGDARRVRGLAFIADGEGHAAVDSLIAALKTGAFAPGSRP